MRIERPPRITSSRKQRNVDLYRSIMKLMMTSIIVKAKTRVARAAFREPLTASANCSFVATAIYRGILAAAVAARSAALQLVTRFAFALSIAS